MFFLSASTNILIYFLIPAFFGMFWYIQEQVFPSEGTVVYTYTTDFAGETEAATVQYIAFEKKEKKTESLQPAFMAVQKEISYLSPHYRDVSSDFFFLRAPPPFFS